MKLIKIKINAIGNIGYRSDIILFSEKLTQFYGPNGSGKTPIIQSIAFCLGYAVKYRQDIYDNCDSAELVFEVNGSSFTSKRKISKDFYIKIVKDNSGEFNEFHNELDYSNYLFNELKINFPDLITNNGTKTKPFISNILPIYYLEQGKGYSNIYSPQSKFIKDQLSEVIRLILDLPIKNSFNKEKDKIKAKKIVKKIREEIYLLKKDLEIAYERSKTIRSVSEINNDIEELSNYIKSLESESDNKLESLRGFDIQINQHKRNMYQYKDEIKDIEKSISSINQIIKDINVEIETLNLNEESIRIFRSFSEICPSENCKLFNDSSMSYSKNLLYLKDQVKDLNKTLDLNNSRLATLYLFCSTEEESISKLNSKKIQLSKKNNLESLLESIKTTTKRIFDCEREKNDKLKVSLLEEEISEKEIELDKALDVEESFANESTSSLSLLKAKNTFRDLYIKWLDILETKNLSYEITFEKDFTPIFGEEKMTQINDSSTKVRAIIAYHTALIELFITLNRNPINFIILDTPRQQDLDLKDLDNYINELKTLSLSNNIQIIFSSTGYRYKIKENDLEYKPEYQGKEQKMYLEIL